MKSISLVFSFLFLFLFSQSVFSEEQQPVWDANKIELVSEKLAEGVYAFYQKNAQELGKKGVPLATSGGFIVGKQGVLLIDTMMTARLHNQVRTMIKDKTDKPITWAVNTSYHGDHSYGNYLLPPATKIIQHVKAKNYIDAHFAKDKQFMMTYFGKGRGIENAVKKTGDILVGEKGALTIDLGNKKVLLKDFGFAQTGGDLFVWLANEKILFAGNPIIAPPPALPWLLDGHLDDTLTTMKVIYDFLPEGARVVPGHGNVTDKSSVKWAIDYLQDVRDGVVKSIKEGKSLEETVKALPMEKYKGYQLYGWVHPGLNIPAAYKDLKK